MGNFLTAETEGQNFPSEGRRRLLQGTETASARHAHLTVEETFEDSMTVRSVFWSGVDVSRFLFLGSCFSKKRVNKNSVGNKGPSFFCLGGGFGGIFVYVHLHLMMTIVMIIIIMVIMMVYQ